MPKPKLGRGLAALAGGGTAILSTKDAAADDGTGAALFVEQQRHERAALDFETEVRRRRDAMKAEHLEIMRSILEERESE